MLVSSWSDHKYSNSIHIILSLSGITPSKLPGISETAPLFHVPFHPFSGELSLILILSIFSGYEQTLRLIRLLRRRRFLLFLSDPEDTGHTAATDASRHSDTPPSEKHGIARKVSVYRMYDKERSAGFECTAPDCVEVLFILDTDANHLIPPGQMNEAAGVRYCGIHRSG